MTINLDLGFGAWVRWVCLPGQGLYLYLHSRFHFRFDTLMKIFLSFTLSDFEFSDLRVLLVLVGLGWIRVGGANGCYPGQTTRLIEGARRFFSILHSFFSTSFSSFQLLLHVFDRLIASDYFSSPRLVS